MHPLSTKPSLLCFSQVTKSGLRREAVAAERAALSGMRRSDSQFARHAKFGRRALSAAPVTKEHVVAVHHHFRGGDVRCFRRRRWWRRKRRPQRRVRVCLLLLLSPAAHFEHRDPLSPYERPAPRRHHWMFKSHLGLSDRVLIAGSSLAFFVAVDSRFFCFFWFPPPGLGSSTK